MQKKIALSIAGSDSSGGAGIQADLKSFSYLGVHGTTVLTCITAQNTRQVRKISKVPLTVITHQLDSIFDDCIVSAVKTGMLYNKEIIRLVAKKLTKQDIQPVVDPVMVATSGDALASSDFVSSLKKDLLPHALMITANVPEAATLADMSIESRKDGKQACEKIYDLGPTYVLLKGGHFQDELAVDILYDGKEFHKFILPRISSKKAHGSGCTLSALITGLLASGDNPIEAAQKAKNVVWGMINEGYNPGKGSDVLNHSTTILSPPFIRRNEQFIVWLELRNAVEKLIGFLPPWFIPEVGMNFAYALEQATTRDQICAIDGRINKHKERPMLCGTIDFGVSKHVASIVLAAMPFDVTMRSAMNIRYSQKTIDECKKNGFTIGAFNRKDEPPTSPSTMEWGTKHAITILGKIPDIIYDDGGWGKEPMIRLLGKNPNDVLNKLQKIVYASIR